jgi:hypothetical protein
LVEFAMKRKINKLFQVEPMATLTKNYYIRQFLQAS